MIRFLIEKGRKLLTDEDGDFNHQDEEALIKAIVYKCKKRKAKSLIEKGLDVNGQDWAGRTALIYAVIDFRLDLIDLLTDKGADPNIMDNDGKTALMYSISKYYLNLSRDRGKENFIVSEKESSSVPVTTDNSPPDTIQQQRLKIQHLLIKKGASVDVQDKTGKNVLMHACVKPQTETVKLFLERVTDINVTDNKGRNVLMIAVQNNSKDKVKIIVENNCADVRVKDKEDKSAFMYAIMNSSTDIVKLLLERDVDLDAQDKEGKNALMYAILNNRPGTATLLIEKRADVEIKDKTGKNALIYAVIKTETQLAHLLIEKGTDVNVTDSEGKNALMFAIQFGCEDLTKSLYFDKDTNIRVQDAMLYAIRYGYEDIIKWEHPEGADISIQDDEGNIALMYSAKDLGPTNAMAEFLIEKGTDVNAQDKYGNTAVMIASVQNLSHLVFLLTERGADVTVVNKFGDTALTLANRFGAHVGMIRCLIQKGADVNHKDKDGQTPLIHSVLYKSDTDVVRTLLEAGADVNMPGTHGRTGLIQVLARKPITSLTLTYVTLLREYGANFESVPDDVMYLLIRNGTLKMIETWIKLGFFPKDLKIPEKYNHLYTVKYHVVSPLLLSLMEDRADISEFFIQHMFLTPSDTSSPQNFGDLRKSLADLGRDRCLCILDEFTSRLPLSLFWLSFIQASQHQSDLRQFLLDSFSLPGSEIMDLSIDIEDDSEGINGSPEQEDKRKLYRNQWIDYENEMREQLSTTEEASKTYIRKNSFMETMVKTWNYLTKNAPSIDSIKK